MAVTVGSHSIVTRRRDSLYQAIVVFDCIWWPKRSIIIILIITSVQSSLTVGCIAVCLDVPHGTGVLGIPFCVVLVTTFRIDDGWCQDWTMRSCKGCQAHIPQKCQFPTRYKYLVLIIKQNLFGIDAVSFSCCAITNTRHTVGPIM